MQDTFCRFFFHVEYEKIISLVVCNSKNFFRKFFCTQKKKEGNEFNFRMFFLHTLAL